MSASSPSRQLGAIERLRERAGGLSYLSGQHTDHGAHLGELVSAVLELGAVAALGAAAICEQIASLREELQKGRTAGSN